MQSRLSRPRELSPIILCAWALLSTRCALGPPPSAAESGPRAAEPALAAQPIAGGTELSRSAVVALMAPTESNKLQGCTGIMINWYTIVTAAHCVSVPAGTTEWVALSAAYLQPATGDHVCLTGGDLHFEDDRPPECQTWQYYQVSVLEGFVPYEVPRDLVVLVSQTAFEGVSSDDYAYLDVDSPDSLSSLSIYGYGPNGSAGAGILRGGVADVWDYDQVQLDLLATEARTCHGDSGGPAALFHDPEAPRLQALGILSTADTERQGECTFEGGSEHFVRPGAYVDFIAAAMNRSCKRVLSQGRSAFDCAAD